VEEKKDYFRLLSDNSIFLYEVSEADTWQAELQQEVAGNNSIRYYNEADS
jgi:hypothetical protein